ncbi:TssN family type VI secretion system protein [Xanthovirga aplysinae]|uniref:TssN family type VI secretion system protein n=1 Tax=Xanthovirga aplysinae TaxID=2529853 RepID=UPI0012BC5DA3|nr:TssN family type VI secretion system protein [Xanthovirga aplysinae]MTI31898.1 hypothetical protein [Xanthovirga aplysinae]
MKAPFNELFSTELITLCTILFTLGILCTVIFSKLVNNYSQFYKKKVLIYIILSFLVFGLNAFLGYSSLFQEEQQTFIYIQVSLLLLGSVHVLFVHSYFKAFDEEEAVGKHIFFSLIISLYGMFILTLVSTVLAKTDFLHLMLSAYFCFLIPSFFERTFIKAIAIPMKIMKDWVFPVQNGFSEPNDGELKDLIFLNLEFYKTTNDVHKTSFKAKAPIRMDFGRLFYHFVNDYNDRHEERIEVLNKEEKAYRWVFYLKPPWYGTAKYVNHDLPIYMNGIRENSVVICKRV